MLVAYSHLQIPQIELLPLWESKIRRVYIAKKLTFTTLIDHFTSLYAKKALVYSYQLIKLGLLTQSIRQQKLPPQHAELGIRPGCPCGLSWRKRKGEAPPAVVSCFGKTQYLVFQWKSRTILAEI